MKLAKTLFPLVGAHPGATHASIGTARRAPLHSHKNTPIPVTTHLGATTRRKTKNVKNLRNPIGAHPGATHAPAPTLVPFTFAS